MHPSPIHQRELAPLFHSLERSPDAVFVTDRVNRIVFWNDAARLLLGFSKGEAGGADCGELLSGCDAYGNRYCSDTCPVMRMANRGEIVRNYSLTLRTKEMKRVTASISLLQLRGEAPDEYFLLHLVRPAFAEMEPAPVAAAEPDAPPRPRLVTGRESSDVRAQKLTPREIEVLAMIAAGRTTPEIAERLHIAPLTARSHIQNILEKLEVHSKAEAVAFAFQKNLI
jgi:DNA-binding CsgD family transcriptional regulator